MRLCFEDNRLDIQYESALSLWSGLCSTFTTFSATTPSISAVATSYDALCGDRVDRFCGSANLIVNQCDYSFTQESLFTSCLCQPNFLILDYNCEYLGNISCLGVPATMSSLVGYNCPNFGAVIGTGIVSEVYLVELSSSLTSVGFSECGNCIGSDDDKRDSDASSYSPYSYTFFNNCNADCDDANIQRGRFGC
jgi:hypothetical protein